MKILNLYGARHMHQSPDFRFIGHRHGKYEANIILKGIIELTCNSKVFSLSRGSFAIWKPGVFHMSRVTSEGGAELISLSFELSDDTFPVEESAIFELNKTDMALVSVIDESEGDALVKLIEAFFIRLSGRDENSHTKREALSEIYHNAVNFMADNMDKDLSSNTIAKHCGVCLTTLKKAFSVYSGIGIKAYFNEMKIHRARELLQDGKRVSEVSDILGFSSPAYFSQSFKRITGISPKKIGL